MEGDTSGLAAMISSIVRSPSPRSQVAGDLAGVTADLLWRIAVQTDEFQVVRLPSRLIISDPTLPVATWKTRTGALIRLGLSIDVVSSGAATTEEVRSSNSVSLSGGGLQLRGTAASSVGIELLGPLRIAVNPSNSEEESAGGSE